MLDRHRAHVLVLSAASRLAWLPPLLGRQEFLFIALLAIGGAGAISLDAIAARRLIAERGSREP